VNPNTVARAYRELEGAGFVEKRRTAGTYISDQGSPLARRERLRILTERIDSLLAEARQMDIAFEDVVKLAERRHATMLSASTESYHIGQTFSSQSPPVIEIRRLTRQFGGTKAL